MAPQSNHSIVERCVLLKNEPQSVPRRIEVAPAIRIPCASENLEKYMPSMHINDMVPIANATQNIGLMMACAKVEAPRTVL